MVTHASPEQTYLAIIARLKRTYIEETGVKIRRELNAGRTVAVSYQPGDMTAYDLFFTPLHVATQLGTHNVPAWYLGSTGTVLVAKLNDTRSDFTFCAALVGPAPDLYTVEEIAESVRGNLATASAIKALFNVIAGYPVEEVTS